MRSYRLSRKRGITLIEMIVVIVIVGLSLPVLMLMWQNLAYRSSCSEVTAQASFYAQELMEEIESKRFDEKNSPPWTDSSYFGADVSDGEDKANSATFDDVDDYVGSTDADVTEPASGYTRKVAVDYVRLVNNAWQKCGQTICTDSTDCSTCQACCYKRIEVRVEHKFGNSSLVTIVSGY